MLIQSYNGHIRRTLNPATGSEISYIKKRILFFSNILTRRKIALNGHLANSYSYVLKIRRKQNEILPYRLTDRKSRFSCFNAFKTLAISIIMIYKGFRMESQGLQWISQELKAKARI